MYAPLLDNFYQRCKDQTLGGITDVYVQRRSALAEDWFYTDANHIPGAGTAFPDTDVAPSMILLSSITTNPDLNQEGATSATFLWNKLFIRKETSSFTASLSSLKPRIYDYTLTIEISQFDVFKRNYIERMTILKDLVFIIRDNNGSYYMIGEEQGMKASVSVQSDVKKGDNKFIMTAVCKARMLPREVSKFYAEAFLANNNAIDPLLFNNIQDVSGNNLKPY